MRLRALEIDDLPYLYQWENDARAWADGSTHNPLSQKLLREYIESSSGDLFRDGQLRLIAEEEGATIGCVDLFDLDPRSRRAAIGMYLAPAYRGSGLAADMVAKLEEYAFGFLHLHTLYAIIRRSNTACMVIYQHAGYRESGVLKDWIQGEQGYEEAVLLQKINPND